MRIAGGAWRGRALAAPPGRAVRPTSARVRAALFDVLLHNPAFADSPLAGAAVLDAFAGSGALGLEALSRGAARVHFIDDDPRALACLRENLARLGAAGRACVHARDAAAPGPAPEAASAALLDPPWGSALAAPALAALAASGWLASGAAVALAHSAAETPAPPGGFALAARRRWGRAAASFLRLERTGPRGRREAR